MLAHPPHRRDVAWSLLCGRIGAERPPLLHQPTPLLEAVATLICLLDRATDDVRQGSLDDLIMRAGAICRPGLECRAEAVGRYLAASHAPQQHRECHIGKRLAGLAGKHEAVITVTVSLHLLQDGECANGKRDAMLSTRFHAFARNSPGLVEQIKLRPPRTSCLSASGSGQNGEL